MTDKPFILQETERARKILEQADKDLNDKLKLLTKVANYMDRIKEAAIISAEVITETSVNLLSEVQTGLSAAFVNMSNEAYDAVNHNDLLAVVDQILDQANELLNIIPPTQTIQAFEKYARDQGIQWQIESQMPKKGKFSFPPEENYRLRRVFGANKMLQIEVHLLETRPSNTEVLQLTKFIMEISNNTYVIDTGGGKFIIETADECKMFAKNPLEEQYMPDQVPLTSQCCEAITTNSRVMGTCGLVEVTEEYFIQSLQGDNGKDFYVYSPNEVSIQPECTDSGKNSEIKIQQGGFIKATCPFTIKGKRITPANIAAGAIEVMKVLPFQEVFPLAADVLKFVKDPNQATKSLFKLFNIASMSVPHATAIEIISYLLIVGLSLCSLWLLCFTFTWCVRKCFHKSRESDIYEVTPCAPQPMEEWPRPSAPLRPILKRSRTRARFQLDDY